MFPGMFQPLIAGSCKEKNNSEMFGRVSKCCHARSRFLVNII